MFLKDYDIEFEERIDDKEGNCTQVWFIAPKELLELFHLELYTEALRCCICLEFPFNKIEKEVAIPSLSPTRQIDEDVLEDYNWNNITLDDEELDYLINMIRHQEYVETTIGAIPLIDYLEIRANQNGYDSYKELYEAGYRIAGYENIMP